MGAAFIPLGASAFQGRAVRTGSARLPQTTPVAPPVSHVVTAVASKPRTDPSAPKKLSKVEGLKTASQQLRFPLVDELKNDEIFITESAVQIMKFHGSYQQDDRDLRAPGQQKKYQFMLRLKMPAGQFPASMYQVLDDISNEFGNHTLRATTRCAWQVHGILKGSLKPVFSRIMNAGGSCVGACGDLSRNVMCTPAPFTNKLYTNARFVSAMLGELFAPQTGAFSEIWLDGEKAGSLEFWKKDLDMGKVQEIMRFDNGNGVVFSKGEEPIYGEVYLPRKFKIGVTVPGDNSIDIYTQDIGVIVVPDAQGNVVGYNIIVGGGMGRTHRKKDTFARVGDHLGYVPADKLWEACKAIVAAQRDHGNRSVRANARMKYLVDKLGINSFRKLVEGYFGEAFEPFRELTPWKYEDWLGWHEQGDGNLFLGLYIENGRIKDDGEVKLKTALRRITDAYEFDMVVSPNQNIILKNITPAQKDGIEAILKEHSVKIAEEYDMNTRLAMACPAMPLCGLAITEAERVMPDIVGRMNALFKEMNVTVPITMRMTGCPNGCARPYMAELGFVGSGPSSYQLWLGGCPNQTRLAWSYKDRVKDQDLESTIRPVLTMYNERGGTNEAFGDFCHRMTKDGIEAYVAQLQTPAVANGVPALKHEPVIAQARTESPSVAAVSPPPAATSPRVTVVSPMPSAVQEIPPPSTKVTVVKGPPKITIVEVKTEPEPAVAVADAPAPPEKSTPAEVQPVAAEAKSAGSEGSEEKSKEEIPTAIQKPLKKRKGSGKPRPRLTVSNEIMERLKNIAALRDMSASMVADEIICAYLSGVEDEDLAMDI